MRKGTEGAGKGTRSATAWSNKLIIKNGESFNITIWQADVSLKRYNLILTVVFCYTSCTLVRLFQWNMEHCNTVYHRYFQSLTPMSCVCRS